MNDRKKIDYRSNDYNLYEKLGIGNKSWMRDNGHAYHFFGASWCLFYVGDLIPMRVTFLFDTGVRRLTPGKVTTGQFPIMEI